MKSMNEIKISRVLEKEVSLKNAKVPENKDDHIFLCKQNDNDCWHRYYSEMGDCI